LLCAHFRFYAVWRVLGQRTVLHQIPIPLSNCASPLVYPSGKQAPFSLRAVQNQSGNRIRHKSMPTIGWHFCDTGASRNCILTPEHEIGEPTKNKEKPSPPAPLPKGEGSILFYKSFRTSTTSSSCSSLMAKPRFWKVVTMRALSFEVSATTRLTPQRLATSTQ
jgi:hypothetical protein